MNTSVATEAVPQPVYALTPLPFHKSPREYLKRTPVRVALISILVLLPCFWQSRIQAGDLSSHLYNAWLSILIGQGKAPGLQLEPQHTNVLFDLLLSGLMRLAGPWGAEHIAVPLVVLVFFWGAFTMICSLSHCRPWYILMFLAMLAYGWVFHMGFMNFHLSMGLSFFAFALLWKGTWKSTLCAIPLVLLACFAHALPVMWLIGATVYTWIARRIRPRARLILTFASVAALIVLRHFLFTHFAIRWTIEQLVSMTGVDQMSVFESKYHPLEFMLLIVWFSLFLRLTQRRGEQRLVFGIPFQLGIIVSAAVLFLPGALLIPGYNHALRYISERMSILVAVSACAVLGQVAPGNREKTAIAILVGLFFSFVYVDTRALNYVESLMEQSVAEMPAGSRVVSALCDERRDVNLLAHTLDRVCIGHCFSYANYEPATAQFRIRAQAGNPIVVAEYRDSSALQVGTYVVKPADVPLYQIYLRGRYLDSRILKPGDVTGSTCFESTPSPNNLLRERRP
jgi:hypothetical protein